MRAFPMVLALVVTGAAAAADASPAGTKTFAGWTATCNNLGACVAIGTAQDDLFYLRIARDAGATAPPEVKIVLAARDPLSAKAATFQLAAIDAGNTEPLGAFPATAEAHDSLFAARLPDGEASAVFIDKVRNATTLGYGLLGAKGTLSLKGLSAALRWIDARQGRAGTPTALVAKGMTPIGQVSPPRAAPIVVAGKTDGVAEIANPVVSQAMALPDCEADVVKAHEGTSAWRLAPDLVLVAVPCLRGAYQSSAALFLTNANGKAPRPVPLPRAPGDDGQMASIATNVDFDPRTLVLTHFGKGRGVAECGETRSWLWTGRSFVLLEASGLEACPGALPADWPNLYTALRK